MIIGGLDPSLTAMAAVAVPLDWGGQWKHVFCESWGYSLERGASEHERIVRVERLALGVVGWLLAHGVKSVFIESYGYAQADTAHSLGELGGVLRLFLYENGIDVRVANMGSARKLLLGKVPRKGKEAKQAVWNTLYAAGARCFTRLDETDAFVCANYGMSQLDGGYVLAQEPAPKKQKQRKGA